MTLERIFLYYSNARVAFAVSPAVPAILTGLFLLAEEYPYALGDIIYVLKTFIGMVIVFLYVSYSMALFVAVPLFLLLRRFGLVNFYTIILSSIFVGGLGGALIGRFQSIETQLLLTGCGFTSGLAFWLIYRCRSPIVGPGEVSDG